MIWFQASGYFKEVNFLRKKKNRGGVTFVIFFFLLTIYDLDNNLSPVNLILLRFCHHHNEMNKFILNSF